MNLSGVIKSHKITFSIMVHIETTNLNNFSFKLKLVFQRNSQEVFRIIIEQERISIFIYEKYIVIPISRKVTSKYRQYYRYQLPTRKNRMTKR